ncbi:MAG: magnesium transporter [Planctomycetes bacterium]|nr:magnesium transporter [Planctomycetota bacterium]MBL7037421.1 magnesium transporter [Pirellulaceae bacterium]
MVNTLYLPELREMLAENNADEMREFCTALHPARTAEFMEGLTADEAWRVLQHADAETREEIFGYFDEDKQLEILESQDRQEIAGLVAEMPPDDRVDLLQEADDTIVEEILPLLPTDERRDYLRLREYPEGVAGAVMTTEVAKLGDGLTVKQALEELGRQAEELETIYYLYVVDETDHLRGVVSARQLVSAMTHPETRLGELMETDVAAANVLDDQEEVAQKVARFDLLAIPVVDDEHRMLGIITHDDVIDVMREEATEDAHRIAAVNPLEESYMKTPVFTLSWKRGVWLTILFVFALLTAFALQHFETDIQSYTWLVLFIPLVISSGGNTGNQSATLIITAMATKDIELRDWLLVVRRELATGLLLGGFLALIGFVAAIILTQEVVPSVVVAVTLVLVVICGTLFGSVLPLMFKRLGLDPALMSSPFVAGIIDILGIVIYMRVALLLMSMTDGGVPDPNPVETSSLFFFR